jgi:outer membrane protein assembly factor BamB
MDRRTFLRAALAVPFVDASKAIAQTPAKSPGLPWTQWGGPNRNFHTEAVGLKETWPAAGPRVVWKRPLGDGYSSPAVENGVLYVMYGKPREEVVMAADAETGKTLWEHATPVTFQSDAAREMGNGPYSTPLIVEGRVFTTGVAGRLQCLDKKTGKVLWTQQLWADHGGSQMMYG